MRKPAAKQGLSSAPVPLKTREGAPAGLGARYRPGRCEFLVWAPSAKRVELRLTAPKKKLLELATDGCGYHWATVADAGPGTEYFYLLDGLARPDPASRAQPRGVHGPSSVVDPAYDWQDRNWKGLPREKFVVYELHVGTFSPEGTFSGVIPRLDALKELGVTVLALMPVAQFPGARNWGYDGVYPFAAQDSYGGAEGLKRLVEACHTRGMAVMLDVVYNHLGPEGNYLRDFGPYFTADYQTPWGPALNFDGAGSDEVRRFFIESAVRWLDEFHVDALRLDAVHAIRDFSARPFVEELAAAAHELGSAHGRQIQIIAESSLNDPRVIRPAEAGGWGCDAQYCKDFHHSLHVALTGERGGKYRDYAGLPDLARSYRGAFVYTGQYSVCRRRRHGRSAAGRPAAQFLVFAQDHDEAGNRPRGERLTALADFEALKLAAGAVALSPFIPFLFMGEEYGEEAPFFYFTDHSDKALTEAVRLGRSKAFDSGAQKGEVPDPGKADAFLRSRLNPGLRGSGRHADLEGFYRRLYALRREHPALAGTDRENMDVTLHAEAGLLTVRRRTGAEEVFFILNFAQKPGRVKLELPGGSWIKLLDSAQPQWGGPGSQAAERLAGGPAELSLAPMCVVLYGLAVA
jgi:maltooligosyltrehalose trehalohydrolase